MTRRPHFLPVIHPPIPPNSAKHLLLRSKSRRPNIIPPQLNSQHPLHTRQNLLIGSRRAALKISDDALSGVALGREVLLGHFWVHLLALVGDGGANFLADGGGLDDVVAAVDFGEMLAFDAGFGRLGARLLAGFRSRERGGGGSV